MSSTFSSEQIQQLTQLIALALEQSQVQKIKEEQKDTSTSSSNSSSSTTLASSSASSSSPSVLRPSPTFGKLPFTDASDSSKINYKQVLVNSITLPILGSTISAAEFSSFKFKVKNKLQINDILMYIEKDHEYICDYIHSIYNSK